MRSTVYDRAKDSGFLTSPGHPMTRTKEFARPAPSGAALRSSLGLLSSKAGSPGESLPDGDEDEDAVSEMLPASDDEQVPVDAAAEAESPHGTEEKPVDLVGGKAVIRLDDGQMLELRMMQAPSRSASSGSILEAGGGY